MCRPWAGWYSPPPPKEPEAEPPVSDAWARLRAAFRGGGLPTWFVEIREPTELEALMGVGVVIETLDAGVIGMTLRYQEDLPIPQVPIALKLEPLRDWVLGVARAERRRRLALWRSGAN